MRARGAASLLVCVALVGFAAGTARATVVFSEDFESAQGLNNGKWTNNNSGVIVAGAGNGGTKGLKFNQKTAVGSRDLRSARYNITQNTDYYISVDYKETTATGILVFQELNNGNNTVRTTYVFGDASVSPLVTWNGPGLGYTTYTAMIHTLPQTRRFRVILYDRQSAVPIGNVYFDNLLISDVPPAVATPTPVQWREIVK
ncbi:MAG: hypothetical protein HZB25_14235 [Candidatus Eisenbacteria bacterium]|nr:hypothetical protein [Candidatus Eisenbacteria bacterium]